jgi:hypothetical protein
VFPWCNIELCTYTKLMLFSTWILGILSSHFGCACVSNLLEGYKSQKSARLIPFMWFGIFLSGTWAMVSYDGVSDVLDFRDFMTSERMHRKLMNFKPFEDCFYTPECAHLMVSPWARSECLCFGGWSYVHCMVIVGDRYVPTTIARRRSMKYSSDHRRRNSGIRCKCIVS